MSNLLNLARLMNCTAVLSLFTLSLPLSMPSLYLHHQNLSLPVFIFLSLGPCLSSSLACVSHAVLETAGWFSPRLVEMSDSQNDLQLSAFCYLLLTGRPGVSSGVELEMDSAFGCSTSRIKSSQCALQNHKIGYKLGSNKK